MASKNFQITGQVVDLHKRKIFPGKITVESGKIAAIEELQSAGEVFILPGLIDAHVHVESSMLIPSEFARVALKHGTVAAVSDPHEIANVCGMEGVEFMIENGKCVPFLFHFGAPSCVPATSFESSGDRLDKKDVETLLSNRDIYFLAEMMNFPGAIHGDPEVLGKIEAAKKYRKVIDGHAPGLSGSDLSKYIELGISTDHECMTIDEALEKIQGGMKILIREGSAARNMNELLPLLKEHPGEIMFCTDDSHPDTLLERHINYIVKEAIAKGYDLFDVLRAASINPVEHYGLNVGMLRQGDKADFIVVQNLVDFPVLKTFINGELVFENGEVKTPEIRMENFPNNFHAEKPGENDLKIQAKSGRIRVIEMIDGELYTKSALIEAKIEKGLAIVNPEDDILKLVVLNRYSRQKPQCAFVRGFGLKEGALASSIAHDSHNIIAVGVNDGEILDAINAVIDNRGGLSACRRQEIFTLALPVAGLMTAERAEIVAKKYHLLESLAREMGSALRAPFMALSFLSLLVIPEIKLGDRGLFDVNRFEFTDLFVE